MWHQGVSCPLHGGIPAGGLVEPSGRIISFTQCLCVLSEAPVPAPQDWFGHRGFRRLGPARAGPLFILACAQAPPHDLGDRLPAPLGPALYLPLNRRRDVGAYEFLRLACRAGTRWHKRSKIQFQLQTVRAGVAQPLKLGPLSEAGVFARYPARWKPWCPPSAKRFSGTGLLYLMSIFKRIPGARVSQIDPKIRHT